MGFLDRARYVLRSPATRRLEAAAAEAWSSAAKPSSALAFRGGTSLSPFGGGLGGPPGRPPQIEWANDQTPPSPLSYNYQPGYSNHTFQNLSAPQTFEGFDLDRIKNAVALHRLGWFYETSALMVAILGFAPVMAAASQAIAPILALPRHVHGGDRGLARLVAAEVEEALVPAHGLQPSPFFPPELWGTMALYLRFMGFCVLQHVDGDPDPDTGVRPRYSRIAEPWAIQRWRVPRKAIFYSTEGPIEIKNDGHFTMIEDTNEGHLFDAAILALGEETLAGKLTQEQRLRWQDFFSSPKLLATLPEKVPTHGEAGDAFANAVEMIYGPDGRGVLPYGSTMSAVTYGSGANGAQQFQGTLLDAIVHIFMVLTGSAGTIGNGMAGGAGGPYQPQKGGAWGVRHDLVRRPVVAMVRGINGGHVLPYVDGNYGEARARAKRSGVWKDPVVTIPLPDADRDERIASLIVREKARTDIIEARRANGILVDGDEGDKIADDLELRHVPIIPQPAKRGPIYAWHVTEKVVELDAARDAVGLAPLPDGQGSAQKLADEHARGLDKTGQTKVTEDSAKDESTDPSETAAPPDGTEEEPPVGGESEAT